MRVEGEIYTRTRMVHAVARVADPYDRAGQREGPPLAAGMFVHAEIIGREVENLVAVPRAAVCIGNQVIVVKPESFMRGMTVSASL